MKSINLLTQSVIMGSGLLFLFAVAAKAQPVPDPYSSYFLQAEYPEGVIHNDSGNSTGTFTDTLGSGGAIGTATTTITLGSDPSVYCSAYGTAGPGEAGLGDFDVSLTYGFYILNNGEGTASSVPINIITSGYASFSYSGTVIGGAVQSYADWGLLSANGQSITPLGIFGSVEASPSQVPYASFGPSTVLGTTTPDTMYGIYIHISGSASGGAGDSATATGFVDPQVVIDPSFAQANDYEIVFAPGVLPAPEPSTGSMLMLGITASICARRFRVLFTA
jgi:hypothetical protein